MALNRFTVALTVTAGAYSSLDVVGGRLQLHGIGAPPGIRLHSIVISDLAAQNIDYRVTILDAVPTDIADNAVFDIADADLPKIIFDRTLDAPTYRKAYNDNSIHIMDGLDVPLRSNEGDGDLWMFLSCIGAPTYAGTGDVDVLLTFSPFN